MQEDFLSRITRWSEGLTCDDSATVAAAFREMADALQVARENMAPHAWDELVVSLRGSELLPILLQDPLTRRSYHRPHGHPGDAVLMDLICAQGDAAERLNDTSNTGSRIHAAIQSRPMCKSLRLCHRIATGYLRNIATAVSAPSLLAIGAGHLREIGPDTARNWGRIVVLDHDAAALEGIAARLPQAIRRQLSAHDGLPGQLDGQKFDATYAPVVYNYLTEAAARRLLSRQVSAIRAGGHLMICNFSPETADRGYMEAFMDWKLTVRDEDDLLRLAAHAHTGSAPRIYRERFGQVVILEMKKQG